jgi:peptidoglycan/LPS O-acetylase OafA/YrhL
MKLKLTDKGGSMSQPGLRQEDMGERRYDLDWVRICAFMLLIVYHVGMYYVSWDWHVKSSRASSAMEPLMMLTSPWRLSLLFLVSGVATGYLLAKQGGSKFLRQRSVRLLVPLVFGMAVIVPPQSYLEVVEKIGYSGSYLEFWGRYISGDHGFCRGSDCLRVPTWNHLWFVAYLWVYTLVLYVAVRLFPPLIGWLRRRAEQGFAGLGVLFWPALFLAIIDAALYGRFPSTHALVDDWCNHASYGAVFLFGFALAGARAPWIAIERARWIALGFAILGWVFLCAYSGMYGGSAAGPPEGLKLLARLVFGAEQWVAIVAALGFARRHLAYDSAVRRYLTTAIFPVYILHQTVIVLMAHTLKPAHLNPGVEAFLLVLVTGSVCFLGYEGIRRVPLLRPLFGLSVETGAEGPAKPFAGLMPQDTKPRDMTPQDIN